MLAGTSTEGETTEHALVGQPALPNQALAVLTMAQRTAEEHVATAHQQADKIRTDALAAAEQIARDAQVHAHNVRREADKVLFEARQSADQLARDAQARVEEAQHSAEQIAANARGQADSIAAEALASAEHLKLQAQQRYDDVVGSLGTRREALQQQIEALEVFDREYRARLTGFMQSQLRALWADQPQVSAEVEAPHTRPQHQADPELEHRRQEAQYQEAQHQAELDHQAEADRQAEHEQHADLREDEEEGAEARHRDPQIPGQRQSVEDEDEHQVAADR